MKRFLAVCLMVMISAVSFVSAATSSALPDDRVPSIAMPGVKVVPQFPTEPQQPEAPRNYGNGNNKQCTYTMHYDGIYPSYTKQCVEKVKPSCTNLVCMAR